jgi:hypothetical protein
MIHIEHNLPPPYESRALPCGLVDLLMGAFYLIVFVFSLVLVHYHAALIELSWDLVILGLLSLNVSILVGLSGGCLFHMYSVRGN